MSDQENPPSYPGGEPNKGVDQMTDDAKGFLRALFDFKFQTLITPKVVKFVYAISVVLVILGWFIFLISAFTQSPGMGVAVLIFGPILVILYLAFIRMTLEMYFAIVRMSDDVHRSFGTKRN